MADDREKYDTYPDARGLSRKVRLFENIVLFLSIVVVVLCMVCEYILTGYIGWSWLVLFILIYVNVLLRLAILGKSGYIFKTVWMVILAIIVLWGIDYTTGNYGWSLTYAYPGIILATDVGIMVLMITNHRNWQSYMMVQILMIILSLVPLVLLAVGIISFAHVVFTAFLVSAFLFLGTLIIGDQRARTELKRRFHI